MYRFIIREKGVQDRVLESEDRDQAYQAAMAYMASRGNYGVSLVEERVPIVREVQVPMSYPAAQQFNRSQRRESQQAAYQDGYDMARALSGVFQIRSDIDVSAMVALATKFASWDNYTEMEVGVRYIAGFQQAIQEGGKTAAQITDGTSSGE